MELILASASPRRAEILRSLGIEARIDPANVEEAVIPGEPPAAHVERLAREKAAAVAVGHPDAWVLAGDTVVTLDGAILGKPLDRDDAIGMLMRLQGRSHLVLSGLALVGPLEQDTGRPRRTWTGVEMTAVTFRAFDREFAQSYVNTGEPFDKAGAYGIQGLGAVLVERVEGDYSGVVGLPTALLMRLMDLSGRPYRFEGDAG